MAEQKDISTIKMGKVTVEIPGDIYVHVNMMIEASTVSEDGCIEITDERPLKLEFADGDYWLDVA